MHHGISTANCIYSSSPIDYDAEWYHRYICKSTLYDIVWPIYQNLAMLSDM